MANVTQNPLAFGSNQTTNSDFRIFNADGGSLISQMAASQDFYFETCNTLLGRMINTVPRNVTLTEVIEPVPVKPDNIFVDLSSNGTMTVRGDIRVGKACLNMPCIEPSFVRWSLANTRCLSPQIIEDGTTSPDRRVFVDFKPHNPEQCSSEVGHVPCLFSTEVEYPNQTVSGIYPGLPTFRLYSFTMSIPTSWGVSSFNVRIQDQSQTITIDNGGNGFPLDDRMLPQYKGFCRWLSGVPTNMASYNVSFAVSIPSIVYAKTRPNLTQVRAAEVEEIQLRAVEAVPTRWFNRQRPAVRIQNV